jgi:hypothetical protein
MERQRLAVTTHYQEAVAKQEQAAREFQATMTEVQLLEKRVSAAVAQEAAATARAKKVR